MRAAFPSKRNSQQCSYSTSCLSLFVFLVAVQAFFFFAAMQEEVSCIVEEKQLETENNDLARECSPNSTNDFRQSSYVFSEQDRIEAQRTAVYLVPTLFRENDPEMWASYASHFASHACYAHTHGYTLVLDTTNYVAHEANQATGRSDFVVESNWPYAMRAALNSQTREAGKFDYDWVYMCDVDVLFVNDFRKSMQEFVDNFNLYSSGDDIQIIVAQPFAYLESGAAIANYAFLVRNSVESRWLADEWIRLISGGCGKMTFGDQGYFHVALLKLILNDRKQRGVEVLPPEDDDETCEKVCNMPDTPGAEEREGRFQPQAPYAHERYAKTLACFERRSLQLGFWRGHRTYAAHGPVAFSRISRPTDINRTLSRHEFVTGVGFNLNWEQLFAVDGKYRNLWDAMAAHTKDELAGTAYAVTQSDFISAMTRCFGPVYMSSPRALFRAMLDANMHVFRSAALAAPHARPSTLTARPGTDLSWLVAPSWRLVKRRPEWHGTLTFAVNDMLGTGTAALASLLEAARQLSAQPAWPRDVAQARSCAKCGAVRAVQRRAQGPVNPGYFNFDGAKDTHAPYTMPMPFPNILFEATLNNETAESDRLLAVGDADVRWHVTMLAEPAVRVARAWLADPQEQQRAQGQPLAAQRQMLSAYAHRDENIDVMVRTLIGCVENADVPATVKRVRLCCCHPDEWFYVARRILRERIAFFGIFDRWSLSMRLLEATLRTAYGAQSFVSAWQSWPGLREAPEATTPWYVHAWHRPPPAHDRHWRPSGTWRGALRTHESNTGPYDTNPDPVWRLLKDEGDQGRFDIYNELNKLNEQDHHLYLFGLEEMRRRLTFFGLTTITQQSSL